MGFFDKNAICGICGKKIGLNRYKIKKSNAWVCPDCVKAAGGFMKVDISKSTIEDLKNMINDNKINKEKLSNSQTTKEVSGYLKVNENKNAICGICGKKVGFNSYKVKKSNAWVCPDCVKAAGGFMKVDVSKSTIEDLKNMINDNKVNKEKLSNFQITKEVGGYLKVDENKKEWYIRVAYNKTVSNEY